MSRECDLAAHITPEEWKEFEGKNRAGLVPDWRAHIGKVAPPPIYPTR